MEYPINPLLEHLKLDRNTGELQLSSQLQDNLSCDPALLHVFTAAAVYGPQPSYHCLLKDKDLLIFPKNIPQEVIDLLKSSWNTPSPQ